MATIHSLAFVLQQLDTDGNLLARRSFTVEADSPTVGEFRAGVLADTAQATISLPTTQPIQLLVRNTHATAKITVVWTHTTGAEATITVLNPKGVIALWNESTASAAGVSSLKLTSDTAGGTYELFLGA